MFKDVEMITKVIEYRKQRQNTKRVFGRPLYELVVQHSSGRVVSRCGNERCNHASLQDAAAYLGWERKA